MTAETVVDPQLWYATLPVPSLAGDVGGALAVTLRSYNGTEPLMEKPALSDNVLCVHQGGAKRIHRWQAGTHRSWDVPRDAVSLMPRLQANRWWTEGPVAFTHLTLGDALLARFAREEFDRDPRDLAVLDQVGVPDPLVAQLIATLAEVMRAPPPGRLYKESLLTALILRVLLRHSSMGGLAKPSRARGGLAGWQLRRVVEYMAAHLADDIGAAELVRVVGLSRAQVFRAFRQSTGQTPGRYLLALRIERARQMLAAPDPTLEEIARAVGFGDADSLTRAFRRSVGASPAAWRRAHALARPEGPPD